jgi:ribonucleotide monophosphatase NagD (HAD superfamily)
MATASKTVFCDIDGTLLEHFGDIQMNYKSQNPALKNVRETLQQWDRLNYTIILTTGRKESTREQTEKQLLAAGIVYNQLIMNLPNGYRVVINDKKPRGVQNTAYAINLVRNEGFEHLDLNSRFVTIPDKYVIPNMETPWGHEELVECNDKYAVKKVTLKKDSTQSFHYHTKRKLTIIVFSGQLSIMSGPDLNSLTNKVYMPGETVQIDPYTIYKVETYVPDTVYFESSSNELWDRVCV